MNHLVLLGDSIFDNGSYVHLGELAVIQQVQKKLPAGWDASLSAVDGDYTRSVANQMTSMSRSATHLAVSVGGNDALDQVHILQEPASSMAGALERLATVADGFQRSYRRMLDNVLQRNLPTMVCTIYEGNMPDASYQRLAATALKMFNDVILREAISAQIPVLDLRLVCSQAEDYANPIEPSTIGGDKIANGIIRIMTEHDFSRRTCQIYS